jgi:hypothetical protein
MYLVFTVILMEQTLILIMFNTSLNKILTYIDDRHSKQTPGEKFQKYDDQCVEHAWLADPGILKKRRVIICHHCSKKNLVCGTQAGQEKAQIGTNHH